MKPRNPLKHFRFHEAEKLGEELEAVLRSVGITIAPGSTLERMVLSTLALVDRHQGKATLGLGEDVRHGYRDTAALADLGSQILLASRVEAFKELVPHLRLLNTAEASHLVRSPATDQDANKLFELLTACYAIQWGGPIEVDHPERSKGDNPDVIAVLPEGRLGIACKALHSRAPQTVIDRVVEGLEQIDAGACATGFVFISLKNVVKHENYWPGEQRPDGSWEWSAFPDPQIPLQMLGKEIDSVRADLVEHVGSWAPLEDLFRGRKGAPAIVFHGQAMTSILVEGHPAAATVKMPYVVEVGDVPGHVKTRLLQLNGIMQLGPADL